MLKSESLVVVTGGLSSGKSSVCRILADCGAQIISADSIVHQLLEEENIIFQILEFCGKELLRGKKIDPNKLSNIVFQDSRKRSSLERLLHPLVYQRIDKAFISFQNNKKRAPLFCAEIPLFFESIDKSQDTREESFLSFFQKVGSVVSLLTQEDLCKKRFLNKNPHKTLSDYTRRQSQQLAPQEKARRADYILYNNSSLNNLREQTEKLFSSLYQQGV